MIHGWSGNHLCWKNQVASGLADEFRLVALDLRGHGMSDQPLDADQYQQPRLWASDIAAVIDQCQLDRPTLVAWSYGGFVTCDYVRAYGQDAISAVNLVGAAVTLNESFDHVGPAFLANAPGGANPDLPTRVAALRRFWRAMTEQPLTEEDLETGLCGSVSVPPAVLGALISRQIDSDDVLSEPSRPGPGQPRPPGPDHPGLDGRACPAGLPDGHALLVRRSRTHAVRRGPGTVQPRAGPARARSSPVEGGDR